MPRAALALLLLVACEAPAPAAAIASPSPATSPAPSSPAPTRAPSTTVAPSPTVAPSRPPAPLPTTVPEPKVLYFLPFSYPAYAGGPTTVVVQTDPYARCSISASYLFVIETSSLLVPKMADEDGRVSWSWIVDPKAPSGSWPVVVVCNGAEARTHMPVDANPPPTPLPRPRPSLNSNG